MSGQEDAASSRSEEYGVGKRSERSPRAQLKRTEKRGGTSKAAAMAPAPAAEAEEEDGDDDEESLASDRKAVTHASQCLLSGPGLKEATVRQASYF